MVRIINPRQLCHAAGAYLQSMPDWHGSQIHSSGMKHHCAVVPLYLSIIFAIKFLLIIIFIIANYKTLIIFATDLRGS